MLIEKSKITLTEEREEEYSTTYRVVDLVKDKYNKSFTNFENAIKHCEWCLEHGATELRLITTEQIVTYEKVTKND